ncbi:MAG: glycosyltransferase family 4 protein [Armatimonadota bacterium]
MGAMGAEADGADALQVGIDCLVLAPRPSGVERAVVGLVEGLARLRPEGQRYRLLVARGGEGALPTAPNLTLLLAPAWASRRAGRVLYEQTVAARRLRGAGVQVLHGPASVLPLAWRGPSVLTIHDAITICHPQWCQWHNVAHYRLVMTRSAQRADVVIVQSQWTRAEVAQHLGLAPERVRVAPLGVGEEFRPAEPAEVKRVRERYRLPERYLLCVGNIEPRKNLVAVIAVFEALADAIPHGLVIAGKRGWRCGPILAALEHSPAAGRIRRLEWVPHGDLPALYTGADLLVQWSLHEGFGLPPLEAMACGTAAVVSDGGALPEVSGPAAAVVPLRAGPQGLAAELLRLVEDDCARAELARRGREHAARFTWQAHAQVVSAAYREVAGA